MGARSAKFTALGVGCVLAASLTACSSSSKTSANADPGTSSDTINVGVIVTTTGSFAAISATSLIGTQVSADEMNAQQHKYKIKVVAINTDGTPANALQAVKKSVNDDHVGYVTGFLTSDVSAALSAAAPRLDVDVLDTLAQDSVLVGKQCNANYFKFAADETQYALGLGLFLKKQGFTTYDAVAPDYARGRSAVTELSATIKSGGGTIAKSVYPALGATDFGQQISSLGGSPAQALYVAEAGADAVSFAKQASQFGLFAKYKLVFGQGFLIPPVVPAMGTAVDGVYDIVPWLPGDAASKQFVTDYEAKSKGQAPWYAPSAANVALQMVDAAADKAGSTDPLKVGTAMGGMTADTIQGNVTMRAADHLLLQPLTSVQVSKAPTLVARSTYTADETTPPVDPACHL